MSWLEVFNKAIENKELEITLPLYLKNDIRELCIGYDTKPTILDCLHNEVYGSINGALYDGQITEEEAEYLRNKYL